MRNDSETSLREWQQGILVAGTSLVLALISIKAWRLSLHFPFEYHWDSLYSQAQVKGILDHGWSLTNPNVGAPYGGQGFDWPEGDNNLNFAVMKVFGIFTSDSAAALNLFWLFTFPATAVTGWIAARELRLPPWPAMFCGVVFSILPYHFWRGEGHLLLSAYYAVPLGSLLILRVLGSEPLFGSRRRSAATVACCVILGSTGAYYSAFTVMLLAGAAIVTLGSGALRRSLATGGVIAIIGLVLAVNLSPSLVFEADHGKNDVGVHRLPEESEYEGLSLTQLLLPRDNHRISAFATAKSDYRFSALTPSESAQSLGFIASAGFLWLLFLLAAGALGRRFGSVTPLEQRASVATGMAFLLGTIGGVSSLVAWGVTTQFRSWNRISIFIGFFALLAVGALLARAPRPSPPPSWRRAVPGAVLAFLLAFAVFDQAGAVRGGQFDPDTINPEYISDGVFVAGIEDTLPPDSAIFQLPYLPYPEGYPPPGIMGDYDPYRGYIHAGDDLRWSYGAIKGRAADLGACISSLPTPQLLDVITAAGFSAVWIDRFGYAPADAAALEAEISRLAPGRRIVSPDHRFVLMPITSLRVDPALQRRLAAALPEDGDALADCPAVQRRIAVAFARS